MSDALPVKAVSLVPQRPPMVLIDLLTRAGEVHGESLTVIRSDNLFLGADGTLLRTAMVEMVGQTVAAVDTFRHDLTVRPGMVSVIRDFKFHRDVRLDDEVRVKVTRNNQFGAWVNIVAEVRVDKVLSGQGEVLLCVFSSDS